MLHLLEKLSSDDHRTITLRPGEQVVGSAAGVDVHLADAGVQRMHATLWAQDELLWVTDLDSETGTTVNGTLIDAPTALTPGDTVGFGGRELVVASSADSGLTADDDAQRIQIDDQSLAELALSVSPTAAELGRYYETVYRFCRDVRGCDDEASVCRLLVTAMREACKADRYYAMLGQTVDKLSVRVQYPDDTRGAAPSPSQELLRRTSESDGPIISYDAQVDARFRGRMSVEISNARSVVAVRLASNNHLIGVLIADSHAAAGAFTHEDASCLQTLARVASIVLMNVLSRRALAGALEKMRAEISRRIDAAATLASAAQRHVEQLEEAMKQPRAQLDASQLNQAIGDLRHALGTFGKPRERPATAASKKVASAPDE